MKKKLTSELNRPSAREYLDAEKLPIVVVLDNVRSMNNVGSFFRTCDAFAAEELVLCGITGTPPHAEIRKTALGAEETVKWSYSASTTEAVATLAQKGYTPVAVEQVEGSCALNRFSPDREKKYALIFGNEVNGVDQPVIDLCECCVEIPQSGTKHSINVAVAGGVVLWHLYNHLTNNIKHTK